MLSQVMHSGVKGQAQKPTSQRRLIQREIKDGMTDANYYAGFQDRVEKTKDDFVIFLTEAKKQKKKVAAYGAAAKGNTLINFAGILPDLIPFVVDKNPAKQNKYMPGSRIPIKTPEKLQEYKPDYVLILPWNIADEIKHQLSFIREWGGQFVTAIPTLNIT